MRPYFVPYYDLGSLSGVGVDIMLSNTGWRLLYLSAQQKDLNSLKRTPRPDVHERFKKMGYSDMANCVYLISGKTPATAPLNTSQEIKTRRVIPSFQK